MYLYGKFGFNSLLSSPTAEECKVAVGQYQNVSFFPHALHNPYTSGLQHAVFRLEGNPVYEQACLVITANDFYCALPDSWVVVLSDFLVFAHKEELSLDALTEWCFFRDKSHHYWPDRLVPSGDIGRWKSNRPGKGHPEIREGEILLWNTKTSDADHGLLKTLRIGKTAYSRCGDRIPSEEGYVPVFAQLEEVLALKRAERKN